jgi:hypothetical protein
MTRVRDKAISQWKMVAEGRMKADDSEKANLAQLDETGREVFLSLVPKVVDTVLHHLLWAVEQSDDFRIAADIGEEHVANLRDVSDGLPGELYSRNGWIARYSKEGV